jgi:hypothetical protein
MPRQNTHTVALPTAASQAAHEFDGDQFNFSPTNAQGTPSTVPPVDDLPEQAADHVPEGIGPPQELPEQASETAMAHFAEHESGDQSQLVRSSGSYFPSAGVIRSDEKPETSKVFIIRRSSEGPDSFRAINGRLARFNFFSAVGALRGEPRPFKVRHLGIVYCTDISFACLPACQRQRSRRRCRRFRRSRCRGQFGIVRAISALAEDSCGFGTA